MTPRKIKLFQPFKHILCPYSKWSSTHTMLYCYIFLFIFNSAIVSYCRQTSAFGMTVPAVSQQDCLAHSKMQSRSWSLTGSSPPSCWAPAGDRAHSLFDCCIPQRWDTTDQLQLAAVRDECDIHQSTTEVGQVMHRVPELLQMLQKGCFDDLLSFLNSKRGRGYCFGTGKNPPNTLLHSYLLACIKHGRVCYF